MGSRHQPEAGADSQEELEAMGLQVRYCSHPDGHAPKDCPGFCSQCGKGMNPVEQMMGRVCGECPRKNHREVTGG